MPKPIEARLDDQKMSRVLFSLVEGLNTPERIAVEERLSEKTVRAKLSDLHRLEMVSVSSSRTYTVNWKRVLHVFLELAGQETGLIADVEVDEETRKHLGLKHKKGLGSEWMKIRRRLEWDSRFLDLLRSYFLYLKSFYLTPPDLYPGVSFLSAARAFEPTLLKLGPFLRVSDSQTAKVLRRWYSEALSITSLEEMALREALAESKMARIPRL